MYRKNVAGQFVYFAMINATTGAAMTGATVTAVIAKDGAAQGAAGGTTTERGGGQYEFALAQADTNANNFGLLFTATGAIPVSISIVATAADPTDAAGFGLSRLDAAVTTRASQTSLDTVDDFLDTEIAAIKAKTDNLPADPADASDIASSFSTLTTKVDTIDDFLDTEVAAIKAKTDTIPTWPTNFASFAITAGGAVTLAAGQLAVKKNTQLAAFPFLMVDSADGRTPKTGLTVTATRSIDGAAFGACANAVSELANGFYKITLAAGDLNGDTIALKFTASGADTRNISILTQA